jgi:hypothetical protein
MARSFGKVFASMWADDRHFLSLSMRAKLAYNYLVAQGDLGHAGVIALRVTPWARDMSMSVAEAQAALNELHAERFVVIDREEMLLLVRSLIRRDGVHKQPNVFKSAVEQIYNTRSVPIRLALLAELERLNPAEIKGDSEHVRAEVIAWLKKSCENPPPNPSWKGFAKGSEAETASEIGESGRDSSVFPDQDGSANPYGNPQRAGAREHARVSPSPTPSPTTTPPPVVAPDALFPAEPAVPGPADADKPRGKGGSGKRTPKPKDPEAEARSKLAQDITREWWAALEIRPSKENSFLAAHQIVFKLLASGHAPDAIAEAARKCEFALTTNAMEFQLKRIAETAAGVVVPFQRTRHQVHRNYDDQSIYDIDPRAAGARRA